MKANQISVMALVLVLLILSFGKAIAWSNTETSQLPDIGRISSPASDGIPPGTIITTQNWLNYRQFMPEGMAALFEGKYFWKMPPDVQMKVGPTVLNPLPKNYLAATESYSSQVKIIELPDGGLTLQGYRGGIPFPNPQEPHRGWKILMNLWYRYSPRLLVLTRAWACAIDSSSNSYCKTVQGVGRQLSYNTDLTASPDPPAPNAPSFTVWDMLLSPENERYLTALRINYADLSKPEEVFAFIPSLRRAQQFSEIGHCGKIEHDWTEEDLRSGFDSNLTELDATYIGRKKILALLDFMAPDNIFPEGFFMPLMWPRPSWAKWQVRDVDVISVKKIASKTLGYCYGNRVMYVDVATSTPLWQELYDPGMRLWKFQTTLPQRVNIPGVGPVVIPGADVQLIWDIQHNHASAAGESAESIYVNEQAPAEFQDVARYTTPAGLSIIMR